MKRGDSPTGFARLRAVGAALFLMTVSSACLQRATIPSTRPSLSPKLAPFVNFEDGAILFIGVDVRAAQYVKDGAVFPLGIGLANHSKKPLTLSRESFVLETADGKLYPLVSQQEFIRDYRRSPSDARLADAFHEVMTSRFSNYRFTRQQLFAAASGGTASDSFQLGRLFWSRFYLYFPIPAEGIHDREFTLLVRAHELPDPFVVRFSLK